MIKCAVTLPTLSKVQTRLMQKINTKDDVAKKINLNVALPIYRGLKETAPEFTGAMKRQIYMEAYGGGGLNLTAIRFPTADPIRGHPYVWYAEKGRGAISGKTNPKMRYWTNPASYKGIGAGGTLLGTRKTSGKDYMAGTGGLVFRKNVGAAAPSLFIENNLAIGRLMAPQIASTEISKWLKM